MKQWLFLIPILLIGSINSYAQDKASVSCGIDSVISLARVFGFTTEVRRKLEAQYPATFVSLLDVKQMSRQAGIETSGVKSNLTELLDVNIPCIIGLKDPEHFTVLLDGNKDEVRLLDGKEGALQIISRREFEARMTGYALLPVLPDLKDAPKLQTPHFDQYVQFGGMGQKVEYRFPISNEGKLPLSIEIAGTSCGCTAALLEGGDKRKMTLQAGQSTAVVVSYHVETQAPIQQTVTIKTNDPRRREIYLSVRGQLPPQLTLSPPALYVQQNRGEEPNKTFKVIGPVGTEIEKVWSDLPYLHTTVELMDKDDIRSRWQVAVSGFVQAPIGQINGKVFVRFKDGKEIFLSVRGEIEGSALPGAPEAALLPRAENDHSSPIGSPLPLVKVGQAAPVFTAGDSNGRTWKLSELRGRKAVLLTFFPKCFTDGCANHLSSLRDHQAEFDAADTQILAVSVDAAEGEKGQKAFAKQWQLQFSMIPDTRRTLSMLYGAAQNDKQLAARMSVLIDKQGIMRWIDTDVNVQTHGADVLAKMREIGLAQ